MKISDCDSQRKELTKSASSAVVKSSEGSVASPES